jgi:hypothetical protein
MTSVTHLLEAASRGTMPFTHPLLRVPSNLRPTRRTRRARLKLESLEAREVPAIYAAGTDEGAVPRVRVFDAATDQLLYKFSPHSDTFRGHDGSSRFIPVRCRGFSLLVSSWTCE